jgi:hypothetical protein
MSGCPDLSVGSIVAPSGALALKQLLPPATTVAAEARSGRRQSRFRDHGHPDVAAGRRLGDLGVDGPDLETIDTQFVGDQADHLC